MENVAQLIEEVGQQSRAAAFVRAAHADLIGEDEDFLADIIEGETDLRPTIAALLNAREVEIASVAGTRAAMDALIKRRDEEVRRREARVERIDRELRRALQTVGLKRIELDADEDGYAGGVRLRTTPGRVEIAAPIDELPSAYVRIIETKKADKAALKKALAAGEQIVGVSIIKEDAVQVF